MVKLELILTDIDYDALAERFLPLLTEQLSRSDNPVALLLSGDMPASVAKRVLRGMPQEKKDKMAAELINSNRDALVRKAEELAVRENIDVKIAGVSASAL